MLIDELMPGSIFTTPKSSSRDLIICHVLNINDHYVIYRWSSWVSHPGYYRERELETFKQLRAGDNLFAKHYLPTYYEELWELLC